MDPTHGRSASPDAGIPTPPARRRTDGRGTRRIRVLIADDHPVVRCGLRSVVEAEPDMAVVVEAATGDEALQQAASASIDVAVLDLSMPGSSGLSLLQQLRRQCPALPILILSVAPEDQFAVRALRAGASGYVTKRSAAVDLVQAIRHVVHGGVHVSPAIARLLIDEVMRPQQREVGSASSITAREIEILRMLASGMTATRVAQALGISVKTVSTHRARLLRKLDLDSTAGLIRFALERGLIE